MTIKMRSENEQVNGTIITKQSEYRMDMGVDELPSSVLSQLAPIFIDWKDPTILGEGKATVYFGGDYGGCRMKVMYVNGLKNGNGILVRKNGIPWMRFHFVNDVIDGEVLEYDEYNNVIMKGTMKDGKEVGLMKRYDRHGNETSIRIFKNNAMIEMKKTSMDGFYEERNGVGKLMSVSHMNLELMCKDGVSYEYDNGQLVRVSEYVKGKFRRVLKDVNGSTMTEYNENGSKVYEGEFVERVEEGIKRKGKGVEYADDGETVLYVGDWSDGLRNGYGVWYDDGEVVYKGEWKRGVPCGKGMLVKEDGSIVEGEWENGYMNIGGKRWLDYAKGKEYTMYKRRLPRWIRRGGKVVPSVQEVMGGSSIVVPMLLLSLVYGYCLASITGFSMYISQGGSFQWHSVNHSWWGWTCPIWYVSIISLWRRDGKNKNETMYFELNALLHAVTMASLQLLPCTLGCWLKVDFRNITAMALAMAVSGLTMQLVTIFRLAEKKCYHSLKYVCIHLVPLFGMVAVNNLFFVNEMVFYSGLGFLVNGVISLIVERSRKPPIQLCMVWDVIQLVSIMWFAVLWIVY